MNTFLAVLTGGGIAAAGGLVTGWLNNWMGGKRDGRAYAHQQRMAREALGQDRLDRAYTELGIYLAHRADWAMSIQPFTGPVAGPDPMPRQDRYRIAALVSNHGSPEVRALLGQWFEVARKIENAGTVITMAGQSRNPGELDQEALRERLALEDYRKQLQEAADRIRDRMSAELNGQAAQGES
jgi:signal transduction histidine kinase